jgi:putative proteasome-type protease
MTYCVGISLHAGMIFASDSRTNAGVDQIGKYTKMHIFEVPGERVIVILNSGNLSMTQNTMNLLKDATHSSDPTARHILNASSLFEVAEMVGQAMRTTQQRESPYLPGIDISSNYIIGGQIRGEAPRLFMLYSQGNFIESGDDTCFFQVGETKYGKPIIDRVVKPNTSLVDAAKCVLISFDSTMRSNISVGLPIDLLFYETDSFKVKVHKRLDEHNEYYMRIHHQWGHGLRELFHQLPSPDWEE